MARKKASKGDLAAVQEPAPGDLRIVHAFVNTIDRRMEAEELANPRALGAWLAAHGLPGAAATLTKADLRQAIEVREGLRALLAANSGLAFDERAVKRLAKLAAQARYQVRVAGDGTARFQPVAGGFDAALARLLEIVVSAQVGVCGHASRCAPTTSAAAPSTTTRGTAPASGAPRGAAATSSRRASTAAATGIGPCITMRIRADSGGTR